MATNYTAWDLVGSPMAFFNGLPADVQKNIIWIVGFLAFIFLLASIITLFGHGTGAHAASLTRDSGSRSHHLMGVFFVIVTAFMVFLFLALLIGMYMTS